MYVSRVTGNQLILASLSNGPLTLENLELWLVVCHSCEVPNVLNLQIQKTC